MSIVTLATFHPNNKVQSAAMHFFLGSETDADGNDDSNDEDDGIREVTKEVKKLEHGMHVGSSGKKKERMLREVKKEASKVSHGPSLFGQED